MLDSQKFKGLYRIDSIRLNDFDYSQPGLYFVTICTNNHAYYFGDVMDETIVLSVAGQIALKYWNEIPSHFPNVQLDNYVIMPNHIHGIINIVETTYKGVSSGHTTIETPKLSVSTLGVIINQYKRICTITMKKEGINFAWQSRFYDHIIREGELDIIRQYIINNPKTWKNDDLYFEP